METRPSALVAIAALSRLGAVAVLLHPDADLAAEVRLGGVSEIITDPTNLETARQLPEQILVLGGGESRDLHLPDDANVIDMEKIDPDAVELPGLVPAEPGLRAGPRVHRIQHRQRATRRQADHQLPLGAVGVRHRLGGRSGPHRHGVLPDAAAPRVRAAGQPRRGGGRWHPYRAVPRAEARAIRRRAAPVRRHRRVLHVGHASRRHRRPGVRTARQSSGAGVHRLGHADRSVAADRRRIRARSRRRVLRDHRRACGAGQRVRRQDRQQGPAVARRRTGRTGRL